MSLKSTWPYAAFGLVLSAYAIYVEHKMAHKPDDEEFSALCDIDQIGASCSNVFQLPEGRMLSYFGLVPEGSLLDVPNAMIGATYYIFWLFILPSLPVQLTLLAASLAMSSSIFLATKLVILGELCVLCWSTHLINSRLIFSAYQTFKKSTQPKKPQLKQV
mmetsp:Transcript_8745/g.23602  ORF Transcript_8745/g.23602 Transcript_8745/m.23602 type:complete len:161 (+) Transcript_8745:157-639(+)